MPPTTIDDLPAEILLQIFHDLHGLAGGPSQDLYGSSLVFASAVCQRWFELTFDVYWQEQRRDAYGAGTSKWWRSKGIEYYLWGMNLEGGRQGCSEWNE